MISRLPACRECRPGPLCNLLVILVRSLSNQVTIVNSNPIKILYTVLVKTRELQFCPEKPILCSGSVSINTSLPLHFHT